MLTFDLPGLALFSSGHYSVVPAKLAAKAFSPPGRLAAAPLDHGSPPVRRHPHDLYFDIGS